MYYYKTKNYVGYYVIPSPIIFQINTENEEYKKMITVICYQVGEDSHMYI